MNSATIAARIAFISFTSSATLASKLLFNDSTQKDVKTVVKIVAIVIVVTIVGKSMSEPTAYTTHDHRTIELIKTADERRVATAAIAAHSNKGN